MRKVLYVLILINAINFAMVLCASCTNPLVLPNSLTTPRTVLSTTLPLSLTWQIRLDEIVVREPVVIDEQVLLITSNHLIALDAKTGTKQWQFKVPGKADALRLAQGKNGVVYVGSDYALTALSLADGAVLWQRPLQEGVSTNIVADVAYAAGHVFAASATSGTVYAYAASDGALLWSIEWPPVSREADLEVVDDLLYVFSANIVYKYGIVTGERGDAVELETSLGWTQHTADRLYTLRRIFDLRTLSPILSFETPQDVSTNPFCEGYWTPYTLVADGFYATATCGVYRLNEQGKVIWVYHGDAMPTALVAEYNGHAYTLLKNGAIVALDAQNGQEVGRMETTPPLLGYTQGALSSRGLFSTECSVIAVFNSYDVWGFTDPSNPTC